MQDDYVIISDNRGQWCGGLPSAFTGLIHVSFPDACWHFFWNHLCVRCHTNTGFLPSRAHFALQRRTEQADADEQRKTQYEMQERLWLEQEGLLSFLTSPGTAGKSALENFRQPGNSCPAHAGVEQQEEGLVAPLWQQDMGTMWKRDSPHCCMGPGH